MEDMFTIWSCLLCICGLVVLTEPPVLTPVSFLTPHLIFSAVNGSDVYMNSCFYGNGTSFVESLFEGFGEQTLGAPPTSDSLFDANFLWFCQTVT